MRKLIAILIFFSFFSCEKNETNDILPDVKVNLVIDLKLPQYNDLQVPSGWSYASGGIKGVIIQNVGIGNPPYKAFERACPNYDCSEPMTFDGSLKLTCPCDGNIYSIIDGSPQTSGDTQYAREYRVNVINSFSLNITNF